jgi:uncharacterized protein
VSHKGLILMHIRALRPLGAVLLCLSACGGARAEHPVAKPAVLRASETTARDLERALARLPELIVKTVTPGGSSITSLEDMQHGKTDIGIAMADVTYLAFAGQLEAPAKPFDQLRGMAVLNLNMLHVLVAPGSRANRIEDLRGERIALGPQGSATALIAALILKTHNLDDASVRTERLPYVDTATLLVRSDLDAAFMTQTPPSAPVLTATRGGARLMDLSGPRIEQLRREQPFLKRALIPAGTYPGQHTAIHTIGVDLVLVCRADVDEDLVYRLLEAYFDARPGSRPLNDLERAPATPLPLHAGAARYYRKRELSR